ncbi:MAG TPA: hypothetical protein DCM14_06355, partial [Clostridiales bacterium UBA8153]|nr:hypothetical protein [Clostridiales bacterium UBA8153]
RVIILPRLGDLRIEPGDHGYLPADHQQQAALMERAGRWRMPVLGPEVEAAPPSGGRMVGIGRHRTSHAVRRHGRRASARLDEGRAQSQALATGGVEAQQTGSAKRRKACLPLARAHSRLQDIRHDALHEATTAITRSHGQVVIADLHVRNLTRRTADSGRAAEASLSRMVLDASFGEFRRLPAYKASLYGCKVVTAPPAYTSQRCAACGCVDAGHRQSQSALQCLSCRHETSADLNAAPDTLGAGPDTLNACGAEVSRPAQSAMKQESAEAI